MRTQTALFFGLSLCLAAPWLAGFRLPLGPTAVPPAAAEGVPAITAAEPAHDFGNVFEGAELEHTFVLSSSGEADLVIHKVKPSCGCTIANMWVVAGDGSRTAYEEGSALPTGAQLAVDTTFKTLGKKGKQEKPVKVYANIPAGSLELTIRANVRPFLQIMPERIVFDRFSVRESREGSAEVRSVSREPLALVLPEQSFPDKLTVRLEPVDPDASGRSAVWQILAKMDAGAEEGPFHHMLQIESVESAGDAAEGLRKSGRGGRISIAGQVLGLVSATPNYMSFGAVRGSAGTSKTIRLNSNARDIELGEPQLSLFEPRDDEPFKLAEHFRPTARPVEDVPGAWDVELWTSDLPDDVNGVFRGVLRVDFGHAALEPFDIPFTGFHRPE